MSKIKELWKRLLYWVKGGIIGALIPLFFFLIAFILSKSRFFGIENSLIFDTFPAAIGFGFILLNSWLGVPISSITGCLGEECLKYLFYPSVIVSIIEFFIIGAFVGWLIGKKR